MIRRRYQHRHLPPSPPLTLCLLALLVGLLCAVGCGQRSRTNGFEPRAAGGKLVFHTVKYKKGSEVIVAYHGWREGLHPCP